MKQKNHAARIHRGCGLPHDLGDQILFAFNRNPLVGKVGNSATVIRNTGERRSKLKAEFVCLIMDLSKCIKILKYAKQEVVHIRICHVIRCNHYCADRNGSSIFRHFIGLCRNHSFCIEGRFLNQSIDVLIIQADKIDIVCCSKGSYCGSRCPGYDESSVDLAILKGFWQRTGR